jgi:hypothetical protein
VYNMHCIRPIVFLLSFVVSVILAQGVWAQTNCIAQCVSLQTQCEVENNQCVRRCHLVRGSGLAQCSTDCTLSLNQCLRGALENCKTICRSR